ncbi:hypothetical protein RvY_13607 [Ramazzottius varieornatus]|uniref:Uncharacterized protein n=1 Tax=Ramazzottius varieornatus TaxID=947166 RepID=A0A1D1VNF7_RAMVA|nr:hypothetical protein RvY_13607 [Ramazzottius varieornatus]
MDSVNLLNVLKLLEDDYKQFFQLGDQPSEADKQLKPLITLNQAGVRAGSISMKSTSRHSNRLIYYHTDDPPWIPTTLPFPAVSSRILFRRFSPCQCVEQSFLYLSVVFV